MHLVLTKYNAPLPGSEEGHRPGLDPQWLAKRLRLFAAGPLASMRAQTAAPDSWLLFVDARTPETHTARLMELTAGVAQVVLVDEPLTDAWVQRHVHELVRGDDVLVTTRLDSDDALSSDHLLRVRRVAPSWRGYVNPRSGLLLAGARVLRRWDNSSPFLSYIEDVRPGCFPRTVLSVGHHRARRAGPLRQLGGPPAWLQVVHGGNVATQVQGIPWPRERAVARLGSKSPSADLRPTPEPPALIRAVGSQVARQAGWQLRLLDNETGRRPYGLAD